MRQLLMKAGVPLVAGALVLTGFSASAFASAKHHATAKPTYTLAYEGPLSGGNAQLGLNMAFAVQLAINEANAGTSQFGNLPFKLKYSGKDDQGSATVSPTIASQLVSNKSVIGVVGPAFSGATKAAEPTFSSAHLATVSPSATNPALSTFGWRNFFRVVADDSVQGPADANYVVKTLKFKKIYNINDASTYGQGLSSAFGSTATADGASVTSSTVPNTTGCGNGGTGDPTQYPTVASTIVAAKPQIVFYGGYYCDLGLLLGALHTAGYTGKVMSGDGSDDPHLILGTSPASAANGVYLTCACSVLGATAADKAFATGFKKIAKFAPGTYSAEAFDAANTIIDDMKIISAKHGGTKNITRAAVIAELDRIKFVGLTKTISFEVNGNIAGSAVYVNEVKNGVIDQLGLE